MNEIYIPFTAVSNLIKFLHQVEGHFILQQNMLNVKRYNDVVLLIYKGVILLEILLICLLNKDIAEDTK